jgi:L-ascorbate metabolism protein UlaG (beta-lactamase superfamily)
VELQYFGANCIRINTKKATIVVDDNLEKLGLKTVTKSTDINLRTHAEVPVHPSAFSADMPGEYEIAGIVVNGIPARAHMDEAGKQSATIYTIEADDVKVAVIGHIFPELSEEQLEKIGMVDVVVVPVGGNGYTLDGVGALQVIKKIEPKIVIPTHYGDLAIRYEVPQQELADGVKGLGMEVHETLDKFKFKPAEVSDVTRLVVLNRA